MLPPSAHTQRLGSLQSPCVCRSRKGTPPAHHPPRVNNSCESPRAAVRFCSLLQVHTSGDRRRTDSEMHDLRPSCCGSFLQPSASAHLRAQVKNGPGDACTYTRVLRFVSAAFCKCTPPGTGEERTPRCMHLCLRAAVRFCSLLQAHTSGDR